MNRIALAFLVPLALTACAPQEEPAPPPADPPPAATTPEPAPVAAPAPAPATGEFVVSADRFADIEVLRYQIPGFEDMPLSQKKLAYFLSQAALAGHDIIWDQNYVHNLRVRKTLAAIIETWPGDRSDPDYQALLTYAKRVWFANGIHHHLSLIHI